MQELIPFVERWAEVSRLGDKALRKYVMDELRRLDREGAPLLRAVLNVPDEWTQSLALGYLDPTASDDDGQPVLQPRAGWMLRLVEGAQPPPLDPQGRPLPAELRGKVLRAKLGNIGGNIPAARPVDQCEGVNGEMRTKASATGRNLYVTADVTAQARPFVLAQAVGILRQWGAGIVPRRFRSAKRSHLRPGEDAAAEGQSLWLVEEVPPAAPAKPSPRNPKD